MNFHAVCKGFCEDGVKTEGENSNFYFKKIFFFNAALGNYKRRSCMTSVELMREIEWGPQREQ